MEFYQCILCPVDYSSYSIEALKHALAISARFGARIVLLHVFNLPGFVAGTGVSEELLELPRRQLKEFAALHTSSHPELETNVIMGHIGDNIIETAAGIGADLIVMGSHGYTGMEKLFLGSTAEYILEHSKSPTLIIRL